MTDDDLSFTQKLSLFSMRLIGKGARFLGINKTHNIAIFFAMCTWHFNKSRQKLAIRNIQRALHVDYQKAYDIAKQSFKENFCSFSDLLLTQDFGLNCLGDTLIPENPEKLNDFRTRLRPIVCTTAHFGSWEFLSSMAGEICTKDRPRKIIARKYKNPAVQRFIEEQRGVTGAEVLGHRYVAPSVYKALKKTGVVAFLVDHKPTQKHESIKLPFFGMETEVNFGPALLAVRANALVWPMFLNRNKNNTYTCFVYDPLDTALLEGTQEEKIQQTAQFYTDAVENHVRKFPEQWFWMHDRWKPGIK